MKIIDLLNKIANGEDVPKEFKHNNRIFRKTKPFIYENEKGEIFEEWLVLEDLNDEIEIIEEDKKIKKLKHAKEDDILVNGESLLDKIDELIDEVNKLKEE